MLNWVSAGDAGDAAVDTASEDVAVEVNVAREVEVVVSLGNFR